MTLESAQAQQVAVGALAAGVTAQKVLNQQLYVANAPMLVHYVAMLFRNVSKIDDLMEDMQEQATLQNELAQVLSQGNPLSEDVCHPSTLYQCIAYALHVVLGFIYRYNFDWG